MPRERKSPLWIVGTTILPSHPIGREFSDISLANPRCSAAGRNLRKPLQATVDPSMLPPHACTQLVLAP